MSKLSFCMIVKNAQDFLPDCLESVTSLLQADDEWVFVDTGSSDGTLTFLENFCKNKPAQLIHYAWEDHFAKARNQAIQAATGDWLLFLDADERLPADSVKELKKLRTQLKDCPYDGFVFLRENLNEHHQVDNWDMLARLLKNTEDLHFVGRVHERPKLKSQPLKTRNLPQIRIRHLADSPEDELRKEAYYLHLLQLARAEEPSPFLDFHWAILRPIQKSESPLTRLEIVKNALKESLPLPQSIPHGAWDAAPLEASIFEAQLLLIESGQSEAMIPWFEGLDPQYLHAEAWGHYALACMEYGKASHAYTGFLKSLDPAFTACAPLQGWNSWRALSFLAVMFEQGGDLSDAMALAFLALLAEPNPEFTAAIRQQIERIQQTSQTGIHGHLQALVKAQSNAMKARDMQAVFDLGCLLLPLVFNSQVLSFTLIAAQRLESAYITQLLGALGALLWPDEDLFLNAAKTRSPNTQMPGPLAHLLLYAFFPKQIPPGISVLWQGQQPPELFSQQDIYWHQSLRPEAKPWPENLIWQKFQGQWIVQCQCLNPLPASIKQFIQAVTQLPASRCDAFILQRPGIDLRIAPRSIGLYDEALESWHPVLPQALHPKGPLQWFRQKNGPFGKTMTLSP